LTNKKAYGNILCVVLKSQQINNNKAEKSTLTLAQEVTRVK